MASFKSMKILLVLATVHSLCAASSSKVDKSNQTTPLWFTVPLDDGEPEDFIKCSAITFTSFPEGKHQDIVVQIEIETTDDVLHHMKDFGEKVVCFANCTKVGSACEDTSLELVEGAELEHKWNNNFVSTISLVLDADTKSSQNCNIKSDLLARTYVPDVIFQHTANGTAILQCRVVVKYLRSPVRKRTGIMFFIVWPMVLLGSLLFLNYAMQNIRRQ